MYNLLIAIGAAIVTFFVFYAPGILNWWGSAILATVALAGAYVLLARRTLKQFEAVMAEAQKDIMASRQGNTLVQSRLDSGLDKIRSAFPLAKWQFLIGPQIHAQLGMLLFMLEKYDDARPHLEKSFVRIGQARAMLAILHFKAKKQDAMVRAFEEAVTGDKKNSLVWSTYAWCLRELGAKDDALKVLARGVTENPNDEKLKENQRALQNNEKLRMKAYGQEWWALRLEPPPMDFVPAGMRQPVAGFRRGYRQPPKQRQ